LVGTGVPVHHHQQQQHTRKLHDFRMNIGAATFTDPDANADAHLSAGMPMPGSRVPAPSAAAINRTLAKRAAVLESGASKGALQLPRCYYSSDMSRCFMNPFYPLTYTPPGEDPAAR